MDESTLNPTIIPQSPTPPVYGPVATPPAPTPAKFDLSRYKTWFIAGGIVIMITIIAFLFTVRRQSGPSIAPTPSVTATPTPTPLQVLNSFATSSAFINFENSVTTLPDTIRKAVLQDQTITPPILDLNLGF